MIRLLIEPLLERLGSVTAHAPPTPAERALGHLMYAAGALPLVWIAGGWAGLGVSAGLGTILQFCGSMAAFTYLFLYWAIRYRRAPPDPWFVSHLVWLSLTFGGLFLAIAGGALMLAVGMLFAALAPAIAALVVYGPLFGGGLLALWVVYRCARGYLAYLRGSGVGA